MNDIDNRMHILHIIIGLDDGGAEAVLYRLCTFACAERHTVVSLRGAGKYGPMLQAKGVKVYALDARHVWSAPMAFFSIMRIVRETKPDIVQTWMYHANLIGGIAARVAGCRKIVWGIHHTNLDYNKRSTRLVSRLCARLSRCIPSSVVCCSNSSAEIHKSYGYDSRKTTVIYNGYDLNDFSVSAGDGMRVRTELAIAADALVLGLVGRWSPQKDHANLMHALALLRNKNMDFRCLLIGPMMCAENNALTTLIEQYGLGDSVSLLDQRTDVSAIMNALDVHVLSSAFGEAFPNVVAEAMACGTPCVTTNIGDAALIVGRADWIVPPKNPQKLAEAIARALETLRVEGRDAVSAQCRRRIAERFGLDRMVQAYQSLWCRVSKRS